MPDETKKKSEEEAVQEYLRKAEEANKAGDNLSKQIEKMNEKADETNRKVEEVKKIRDGQRGK